MESKYYNDEKLLVLRLTEEIDECSAQKIRRRADYEIERFMPREVIFDFDSVTDFEDINLLDLKLFNENMRDLIDGKEVELPRFDFVTKKRVKGKVMKLEKNSPIIVEGIHALNKRTTELIPQNRKFKIYIGPQIQVNLDDHNPLKFTISYRLPHA